MLSEMRLRHEIRRGEHRPSDRTQQSSTPPSWVSVAPFPSRLTDLPPALAPRLPQDERRSPRATRGPSKRRTCQKRRQRPNRLSRPGRPVPVSRGRFSDWPRYRSFSSSGGIWHPMNVLPEIPFLDLRPAAKQIPIPYLGANPSVVIKPTPRPMACWTVSPCENPGATTTA